LFKRVQKQQQDATKKKISDQYQTTLTVASDSGDDKEEEKKEEKKSERKEEIQGQVLIDRTIRDYTVVDSILLPMMASIIKKELLVFSRKELLVFSHTIKPGFKESLLNDNEQVYQAYLAAMGDDENARELRKCNPELDALKTFRESLYYYIHPEVTIKCLEEKDFLAQNQEIIDKCKGMYIWVKSKRNRNDGRLYFVDPDDSLLKEVVFNDDNSKLLFIDQSKINDFPEGLTTRREVFFKWTQVGEDQSDQRESDESAPRRSLVRRDSPHVPQNPARDRQTARRMIATISAWHQSIDNDNPEKADELWSNVENHVENLPSIGLRSTGKKISSALKWLAYGSIIVGVLTAAALGICTAGLAMPLSVALMFSLLTWVASPGFVFIAAPVAKLGYDKDAREQKHSKVPTRQGMHNLFQKAKQKNRGQNESSFVDVDAWMRAKPQ
jgi:hypothetical protein